MNLPPLRTEPVGSRRGRPRSSISDDDDSMSAGELSDEEHGLPPVLSRFKLSRPQTPGSECSSVSHPSTQSPESIPALLPKEGRTVREPLAAPSPKPLTISPTASERRKVSRQSRRPPSPLLHDPVYSRALTKALQGSELVDITVPQLRTLIKKEPISPQREREWEVHAAYNLGGKETGKEYRCVYNEDKCKYAAKKQLTKRHIQGVHQGIKQYKCPFCPAAFHQETCAITHVSIHLGVFPFLCQFCGKRYNDVGRRFKHSKQEHGYQPKKTRRTPKSKKTQATEPSDSA
ncbi:hypothetical protein AN958_04029 [Leucoagaricus sp. SymC.cos]|nr:hypothetical protein AN958_04029 [Leucoagaricus sp. SymC.cos]